MSDGDIVVLAGANSVIAGAWAFRPPTDAELLAELVKRGVLTEQIGWVRERYWGPGDYYYAVGDEQVFDQREGQVRRYRTKWEPVGSVGATGD